MSPHRRRDQEVPNRVVAIDAVGISGGGGREVVHDVIVACAQHPGLDRLVVFLSDPPLAADLREHPGLEVVDVGGHGLAWRLWWWRAGFRRACRRAGAGPSLHLANIALVGNSAGAAALVHQLNALEVPALSVVGRRRWLRYRLLQHLVRHTARTVDVVFVQSDVVKEMMTRVVKSDQQVQIEVAPPAPPASLPTPRPGRAEQPGQEGACFVYVGSAAPHKNVRLLLEAMPGLRCRLPDARMLLTLDEPREADIPSGVVLVGSQDRQGVADLLAGATALVLPSYSETVGLPMLEAMSLGVPVLASDRPFARAVCADAALYFDPEAPAALRDACVAVATDETLRERLRDAGLERVAALRAEAGGLRIADWLAERSRRS